MVAVSGYRLGFGVLVVPGVAAVALLAWLRRAAPNPGVYEDSPSHTIAAPADQGFSRRLWVYTAFTAMTMLGYATFGVRAAVAGGHPHPRLGRRSRTPRRRGRPTTSSHLPQAHRE
jgi:hypothetical protein